MSELPSYSALAGADVAAIYGLLSRRAESVASTTYEFTWHRDQALLHAIDGALGDVATGLTGVEVRKPRWLDGLVQRELRAASEAFWSRERFVRIRLTERLGLVTLEPDDTYVLAMVSALGPRKTEKLRSDPGLIERALSRVFEVEGGGEVSLANVDRFGVRCSPKVNTTNGGLRRTASRPSRKVRSSGGVAGLVHAAWLPSLCPSSTDGPEVGTLKRSASGMAGTARASACAQYPSPPVTGS